MTFWHPFNIKWCSRQLETASKLFDAFCELRPQEKVCFTTTQMKHIDVANSISYRLFSYLLWHTQIMVIITSHISHTDNPPSLWARTDIFYFQDTLLHKGLFSWLHNLSYSCVWANVGVSVSHPSQPSEQMWRTEGVAAEREESRAVWFWLKWGKSVVWNVL